ncbi:MAG: AraC family transcriptional regulator, partial [Bacteroidota bacterium]
MHVQLETIETADKRAFQLMVNPRLSDLFFWHFHPEYELVYIEAESGTRHVGSHVSQYQSGDLVLIGSNIPHLNFDYGIKTPYRQVVVHLSTGFVEQGIQHIPELGHIHRLLQQATYGLAFRGDTIHQIGQQLFDLEEMAPVRRFTAFVDTLDQLAHLPETVHLHEQPYDQLYSARDQGRIRRIHAFIDAEYHRKIDLQEMADLCHMSKEGFCRYFKKVT